ncbi:MAG: hypothetical protein AMXMBFR48_21640 [Ignavibacteriales bacterium]
MNELKKKKLEKRSWKIGTAEDFLELSPEETEFILLKLRLSRKLQKLRLKKNLTQAEFAKRINSSQSRVAKIEKSDPSVSLDLIVKSLLSLGAKPDEIAKEINAGR